jgi:hypothetical protein
METPGKDQGHSPARLGDAKAVGGNGRRGANQCGAAAPAATRRAGSRSGWSPPPAAAGATKTKAIPRSAQRAALCRGAHRSADDGAARRRPQWPVAMSAAVRPWFAEGMQGVRAGAARGSRGCRCTAQHRGEQQARKAARARRRRPQGPTRQQQSPGDGDVWLPQDLPPPYGQVAVAPAAQGGENAPPCHECVSAEHRRCATITAPRTKPPPREPREPRRARALAPPPLLPAGA